MFLHKLSSIRKVLILLLGLSFSFTAFSNLPTEDEYKCICEMGILRWILATLTNGCVDLKIDFGKAANEPKVPTGSFSVYSLKPSSVIFTPQCLQYQNILLNKIYKNQLNAADLTQSTVNGEIVYTDGEGNTYTEEQVTTDLSSEYSRQVKIFSDRRKVLEFKFKENESSAKISDTKDAQGLNYVMVMVDGSGNAVTTSPVYLDMYLGNGNFVRYSVSTNEVVSFNTATGRVITASSQSVGLDVVYDNTHNTRQVYSVADGLADVVVISDDKYEIRFYSPENTGAKTDGLYTFTGSPHTVWSVENPNPGQSNQVKITKTAGGESKTFLYEYNSSVEDWTLKMPGDEVVVSKMTSWDFSRTIKTQIKTVKSSTGQVAYKVAYVTQKYPFGDRQVVEIVDPDGLNARTSYTYYSDSSQPGSYGRVNTISYPSGNWAKYTYDSQSRRTSMVEPFKNSPLGSSDASAKATYYSYDPVDSRDVVAYNDERPRVTEVKTLGITTSKTYHAYYFDNGEYVEITERCTTPDAAYGDSSNLRTTKRYYASTADAASSGRLKTVTRPDGTMDTYTYEYGNWSENADPAQSSFTSGSGAALKTSVTNGTTSSPAGVAYKSLKTSTVKDIRGNKVLSDRNVYTGSSYERISWTVKTYDQQHHLLNTYYSNGTQDNNVWNCCTKESETQTDGTQYTYTYDDMQRVTSKTKVGIGTQPNIVTTYTYNAKGKVLSTTKSAGGLSLASSNEYNPASQLTKETDTRGLSTTHTYFNGVNSGSGTKGAVETVTLPGGYTSTTEKYLDGRQKELTGDAVIAKYYDYGVNADGSTWSMVRVGRDDSARWSKATVDMLGRTIKEERSGYNGTIVSEYFYNEKEQLVKTSNTGQADTLYVYDELSNQIRSGLDINANGTLDLASTDRINETESVIYNESGAWWNIVTSRVYATDNNDSATITSINKTRLTGFTGNIVSEEKNIDIHGNETIYTNAIDVANKTVTSTVNAPESSVDAQTITVNGLTASDRTMQNLTYTYSYDALGRQTGTTDPRIGTTTTAYYTTGTGKIGQIYTVANAASNVTTYDYSATTGRINSVKNALDKYTYYAYNAMGQITKTWGNTSYPLENVYDNFGQLVQLKTYRSGSNWTASSWPEGSTGTADITTWTYDEASGKVTAKTYADGRSTTYTYTIDGKVASRTWSRLDNSNPLTTTFNYDANTGQVTGVDYSDSTPDIGYTYNRLGQQKTITDAVGTRTFAYNSALQPTTETINGGLYSKTITRDYATTGVAGRYTGFHIGTEYSKSLEYDSYGRLSSLRSPNANSSNDDVFTYAYLANSNLVNTMTVSNGANTIAVSTKAYENNRDLITQVKNSVSSVVISQYDYTNDAIGRRTSMAKSGTAFAASDTITYGYNDRSEVTSAVSNNVSTYNYGYNFDNIGNRTVARSGDNLVNEDTYVSNNLNQYTSVTSASSVVNPSYNDDGCMLTNGDWAYVWNAENRLVEATNSTNGTKLEFKYDYMGRRVEKKVYTGSAGNWTLGKHLKFIYDVYLQIEELDGANSDAILKKRIWGNGEIIADIHGSTTYYALGDANKNITEYIDATGTVQAHYVYSPFGKISSQTGSKQNDFDFRFSSEYLDSETKLVYYNFRYYIPEFGRWTKRDPIEEEGGMNLYVMCNNNIIGGIDHLGYWGWICSSWTTYYKDLFWHEASRVPMGPWVRNRGEDVPILIPNPLLDGIVLAAKETMDILQRKYLITYVKKKYQIKFCINSCGNAATYTRKFIYAEKKEYKIIRKIVITPLFEDKRIEIGGGNFA